MKIYRIYLFMIFYFLCLSIYSQTEYKKLLIYPVLNVDTIYPSDSTYFSTDICVELKIDTIDIRNIKWVKKTQKKKYGFIYNQKRCSIIQLFNLYLYNELLDFKVIEMKFDYPGTCDRTGILLKGNCLTQEVKQIIYKKYKRGMKKYERFYLESFNIKNKSKNLILNIEVRLDTLLSGKTSVEQK